MDEVILIYRFETLVFEPTYSALQLRRVGLDSPTCTGAEVCKTVEGGLTEELFDRCDGAGFIASFQTAVVLWQPSGRAAYPAYAPAAA
jgi:hypothetical protein